MFGLEKLGSVHFNARKCYVFFIFDKNSISDAKFSWCQIVRGVKLSWCQIVRGVKLSWCQIVLGVKLSAVSNCPGVKLSYNLEKEKRAK